MRRAVNFAVDRPALARNALAGFASVPTDQYLPPGTPGFHDADIYPLGGADPVRARALAGAHRGHAVMYTCSTAACRSVGQTVKSDLRAIGITVEVKQFPYALMFDHETRVRMTRHGQLVAELPPGARYDIGFFGWFADYADPSQFIDPSVPGFALDSLGTDARRYRQRIAAVAKLPGEQRLRAYGRLDTDLARRVAPVVAFATITAHDFFSSRIGCQTYQPFYGMDLGDLCIRRQ